MTNHPSQLNALVVAEFEDRFLQISSADGLYKALRRSIEVKSLNSALREEAISEGQVDAFVRDLLKRFVPGERFEKQIAIAAIAVACETINKMFARNFIDYLSKMDCLELEVASRIARHAIKSVSSTRTYWFGNDESNTDVRLAGRPYRSEVGQNRCTFEKELV